MGSHVKKVLVFYHTYQINIFNFYFYSPAELSKEMKLLRAGIVEIEKVTLVYLFIKFIYFVIEFKFFPSTVYNKLLEMTEKCSAMFLFIGYFLLYYKVLYLGYVTY